MDQDAPVPVIATSGHGRVRPDRPIIAASVAVFRDDRVLLARRATPPLAELFSLPGGRVELGETLVAAALRELREEVAVEARILGFNRHVEIVERDADDNVVRHYVIASFVGVWLAGEGTIGPEAKAVVWARHDDIASLPTTDQLLPLLDAAWAIAAERARPS